LVGSCSWAGNGIRLGRLGGDQRRDGEVVELGMFHTVLPGKPGNWTDSSHPTGRRVTFTNSYANRRPLLHFSTSGQWMWTNCSGASTGQDPYPVIDAIQKKVAEATSETAKQAEQEWQHVAVRGR